MGQAGFYILHDDEEEAIAGLPQGDYDIPLALTSKRYNPDGSLWSPEANGETTNLFGDVIHVNGQPWPYFKVEPRKYRFRFLDASISRSFQLYFEQSTKVGTRINFKVVGSDAGLLLNPVDTTQLDISMAERWEVVVDFSAYKNSNVTLRSNKKVADNTDYLNTDKVMQFVVGSTVSNNDKNDNLPAKLRDVPFPPAHATVEHQFEFQRTGGEWKVNGVSWADGPEKRVLAKPQRGAVENWILKNGAGGWTHPVHIHLIDFQVVARTGGSRGGVLPYEKVALKDVVWLNTNEQVNVIARYAPWDGFYMFHCHNLIHEDHEMMAAFNVTALTDLGYDEKTSFIDPMEARYRSKHFSDSDLTSRSGDFADSAIQAKVGFFNGLEAYRNKAGVESALEQYWATKSSSTVAASSTNGGGKASSTLATVASAAGSSAAGSSAAASATPASAAIGSSAAAGTSSAAVASSTA
jgi:bilirubin oxidase